MTEASPSRETSARHTPTSTTAVSTLFNSRATGASSGESSRPSRLVPGLFGGGLQDNGDVYAAIDSPSDEYLQLEGGDGHVMVFIDTGHGLHCNGDNVTKITANRFDGAHLVDGFTVPVGDRGPGGYGCRTGLHWGS